jgi:predicted phage tail protein
MNWSVMALAPLEPRFQVNILLLNSREEVYNVIQEFASLSSVASPTTALVRCLVIMADKPSDPQYLLGPSQCSQR